MSYIGKEPQVGGYNMLDSLTASATADYTLQLGGVNFTPESANHLIVSLNGIVQKAGSSFTVSGSTLSFSSALTASDSIDFVLALGNVLDIGTPSDSTISTAKIIDGAVTNSKLANSSITLNGSAVSLGGSTSLVNTPSWLVKQSTAVSLSDFATTKVTFDVEELDTDSAVASSRFTVPSGQAGNYYLFSMIQAKGDADSRMDKIQLSLRKNGTGTVLAMAFDDFRANPLRKVTKTVHTVANLSVGDYVEVYIAIDINAGIPYYEGGEQDALFGGYKLIGT